MPSDNAITDDIEVEPHLLPGDQAALDIQTASMEAFAGKTQETNE